jgi:hypothetical protein
MASADLLSGPPDHSHKSRVQKRQADTYQCRESVFYYRSESLKAQANQEIPYSRSEQARGTTFARDPFGAIGDHRATSALPL